MLLDAEQIKSRRIPLEDAALNLGQVGVWHCNYCNRRFTGENTFMKHHCEPRRRAQELASPLGQAAYGYYRTWMRMKKFSQPGSAAFLESKFYRAFINFSQMIIDANIPNPERYIEIMVAAELQPVLWCRDSAYALYIDWSDKISDPLEQVQESIEYLIDIAGKDQVPLENIFEHLGAQQVISLIRQRRLTPWLLFCSARFGALLKTLDKEQLVAFNTIVNASYWGDRFQKETGTLKNIKEIVKALGL